MHRTISSFILTIVLFFPFFLYSQGDTLYTLRGTVRDEENHPYIAMQVDIFQLDRSTRTDTAGRFRFDHVPNGVYALVFHHPYGKIYKSVTVEDEEVENEWIIRREIKFDEIVVKAVRSWHTAPYSKERLQGKELRKKYYGQDIPQLLSHPDFCRCNFGCRYGNRLYGCPHTGNRPGKNQCNPQWHPLE